MSSISRLTCSDGSEVSSHSDINNELHDFYKKLYSNRSPTTGAEITDKLNELDLKTLSQNEIHSCEAHLTEAELYSALLEMNGDTSPGNDGLIVKFYKLDIKYTYMASIIEGKIKGVLSTSQG